MDAPAYLLFRMTEVPNRITRRAAYSEFWDEYHCHKELQFKWVRVFELEITEEQFKWIRAWRILQISCRELIRSLFGWLSFRDAEKTASFQ